MRRLLRQASWLTALLPLTGCSFFRQLTVEPLATTAQRPANVAAYVAVSDGDTPLTELQPSNFRVYENEQLLTPDQTQLTLLDPGLVAAQQVVLLVDMSSAKTPEARTMLTKAALGFVQKVAPREAVAIFAFDGSQNLSAIAAVPRGGQAPTLAGLEVFTSRDPSRNLNGAIAAGLSKLDQLLTQTGRVVRLGTLVVYAAGPDLAGRVDADKAHDLVWDGRHDVVMIGVAKDADAIENLARSGLIRAQAPDTVPIAFEEAASRTIALLQRHYLVSYCSPARVGKRRVRIEVTFVNQQGEEHHGDFDTEINAKGFSAGCNSLTPPRFNQEQLVDGFTSASEPKPEYEPGLERRKGKKPTPDARTHDQGEDAPVAPPEQPGYAK